MTTVILTNTTHNQTKQSQSEHPAAARRWRMRQRRRSIELQFTPNNRHTHTAVLSDSLSRRGDIVGKLVSKEVILLGTG